MKKIKMFLCICLLAIVLTSGKDKHVFEDVKIKLTTPIPGIDDIKPLKK